MDLWPGVDIALCADGRCDVADLARGRMENTTCAAGIISFSMAAECAVDAAFFWAAPFRPGLRGNYYILAGADSDTSVVLERAAGSRCFARALSGMGDLCCGAELHHL